jgi:AAA15 family ATPase/GTPase
MLIRFGVQNHMSIRDKQELSLVASSLKDKGADLISFGRDQKLLPVALIYGANASGKSNLVSALSYFSSSVENSHAAEKPGRKVPHAPFVLDETFERKPSRFDVDIVLKGTRYHYGYLASKEEFLEEWLFAFPAGKKQTWFLREKNRKRIYVGKNLKGATKLIESVMRPNSLFLSAAAQNSHKQLTPIYDYIAHITFCSQQADVNRTALLFEDGKIDKRIISFLKEADTGVADCKFEDLIRDAKQTALAADLVQLIKKHTAASPMTKAEDLQQKIIYLGHETKAGKKKYLPLTLESTGTIRLLALLKSIYFALDNGTLLVIDELDASLHTYLTEKIVSLFNSRHTNPKGAQLVATTHDTNLLSGQLLRRDQIWFAEKDNYGATALYPLSDIRTRNTDNLERGYLDGRFGAVPFGGSVNLLLGSE